MFGELLPGIDTRKHGRPARKGNEDSDGHLYLSHESYRSMQQLLPNKRPNTTTRKFWFDCPLFKGINGPGALGMVFPRTDTVGVWI